MFPGVLCGPVDSAALCTVRPNLRTPVDNEGSPRTGLAALWMTPQASALSVKVGTLTLSPSRRMRHR